MRASVIELSGYTLFIHIYLGIFNLKVSALVLVLHNRMLKFLPDYGKQF